MATFYIRYTRALTFENFYRVAIDLRESASAGVLSRTNSLNSPSKSRGAAPAARGEVAGGGEGGGRHSAGKVKGEVAKEGKGKMGKEVLELRREIEALKVARLRKRLLRKQRQQAQGGAYPETAGGSFGDGWRQHGLHGRDLSRQSSEGAGEKKRMEEEEIKAERDEEHKQAVSRREHADEHRVDRLAREAEEARRRRMHEEQSLEKRDLAEVAAGGSIEKALTKALAAKVALLDAIKAKSDEIARLHANALAAPVRETHRAREVRHSAQHRLTDQMRSDEILLRRLEGSQQRGVIPKSQALRQRAQLAEEEELSKLRNKRLALKHKLLLETIKRLKDKLDQRGVPDSVST